MKKLIAILLSALLLCSLMSFATVSAEDGITMEAVTVESANAGDTIEVTVNLLNNPGLTGCQVELKFDSNAFKLVTNYDEDEEMWIPAIEVGSKFSASSNKYILFAPIDEETGFSERCLVQYMRSTSSNPVTTETFFTATFKVKDDAPSGTYTFGVEYGTAGNVITTGNVPVPVVATNGAQIIIKGVEPACEHTYDNDCDADCNKCGEKREAGHDYVAGESKDATCGADGSVTYTCSKCNDSYTDTIPATGAHEYVYVCDKVCKNCGQVTNSEADHTIVHVDAKTPTCTEIGNIEYWYCSDCGAAWADEPLTIVTNQQAVKLGASCKYSAEAHEAVEAGCHYIGMNAYWYCANCDMFYADADCTIVTNYKSLIIPALKDSADYVAAKEPTCTENGNVEYWVCYDCEKVWADEALTQLTTIKNVQIAPSCKYNAVYTAAKEANCNEPGNIEYWYCATCDVYYLDADCTIITNSKNVIIPITHNIIYVEAKAPTCTALGNIEHWYCADCGQAWLDELLHQNTNLKAVVLPMAEHTYDNAHDTVCNVCSAERSIPAEDIVLKSGNSISENKGGLAFKFDVAAKDVAIDEEYIADYTNAIVEVEGVEYKLVMMGVIANNKQLANQTLDNVDGKNVLNVEAAKAFEMNGVLSYAIRVINIPEDKLDTEITLRSYFIYEKDGEQVVVYGEDWTASYNAQIVVG